VGIRSQHPAIGVSSSPSSSSLDFASVSCFMVAACSMVKVVSFQSSQEAKEASSQIFIYMLPKLESSCSDAALPAFLSQFLSSPAFDSFIVSLAI
jgi:hypothetical protein